MSDSGTISARIAARITAPVASVAAVCALVVLRCGTVDPQPQPLTSPSITGHDIVAIAEQRSDGFAYNEGIRLDIGYEQHMRDLAAGFILLYTTSIESAAASSEPIPDTVHALYLSVKKLGLAARSEIDSVTFSLFAVDQQNQPGDTSTRYTVSLAPHARLIQPEDTLESAQLRWELSNIGNPVKSKAFLWNSDSLVWESLFLPIGRFEHIGNDRSKQFETVMPDTLVRALARGEYVWGVRVEISGNRFPASLQSRGLYAPH